MDLNKEIYKVCQLISSAFIYYNMPSCPTEEKYIKDKLNLKLRADINNLEWLIHYFESLIADYNTSNPSPHKLTKYVGKFKDLCLKLLLPLHSQQQ